LSNILILEAHPDAGRFCGALADAYAAGASGQDGASVRRLALRDLHFDPILRGGFGGGQPLEPDLLDARAAIEAASHLVIVTPIWWGALPALLKGFIDRVFLPGWAFRNTGAALPEGLLAGRTARVVSTMDSPWWWYTLYHLRAAHRALVQATLRYVGFHPVSAYTVHRLRALDASARSARLAQIEAIGRADAARVSDLLRARKQEGPADMKSTGP
jgi:putative NADPH-quinone reductase